MELDKNPKRKYRLKSRAVLMSENLSDIGFTIDGYLMISKDGGKTYETVFEPEEAKRIVKLMPKLFVPEAWDEEIEAYV